MTFNEEPTKTLREWVYRIVDQNLIPTENELVQQVILGREIFFHADFADMSYVKSKTNYHQLDADRKQKAKHVNYLYVCADLDGNVNAEEDWTNIILSALTRE